jgi:hypothetical protein
MMGRGKPPNALRAEGAEKEEEEGNVYNIPYSEIKLTYVLYSSIFCISSVLKTDFFQSKYLCLPSSERI